jgi:hypothetical protein
MPSEIRVNTIKSRAGLGTFDISDSGLSIVGIMTATSFSGDGSGLTGVGVGTANVVSDSLVVSGISTLTTVLMDSIIEMKQEITQDYTIGTTRNALSAGPITIGAGITVTVPSGSSWTIV